MKEIPIVNGLFNKQLVKLNSYCNISNITATFQILHHVVIFETVT